MFYMFLHRSFPCIYFHGVVWEAPGHWAAWYSSQCEAAGLWRWTPEWTAWCAHGRLRLDTLHSSSGAPSSSPLLLHCSSHRRHCPGCSGCPVSEDCSPCCCRHHLEGRNNNTFIYLHQNRGTEQLGGTNKPERRAGGDHEGCNQAGAGREVLSLDWTDSSWTAAYECVSSSLCPWAEGGSNHSLGPCPDVGQMRLCMQNSTFMRSFTEAVWDVTIILFMIQQLVIKGLIWVSTHCSYSILL